MGYPSTVDNGLIQPLSLYEGDPAAGSVAAPAATKAYFVGVTLLAQVTLTGVRCRFGTGGNGHYDVGIYDATGTNRGPGNQLAHAASSNTALVTAAGNQTPALIGGNLTLAPGNYWLAFWCDNATDTIVRVSNSSGAAVCISGTTSGPLPASAPSLTLGNDGFKPLIYALISGGWS